MRIDSLASLEGGVNLVPTSIVKSVISVSRRTDIPIEPRVPHPSQAIQQMKQLASIFANTAMPIQV